MLPPLPALAKAFCVRPYYSVGWELGEREHTAMS
jgi:hypothetical protein